MKLLFTILSVLLIAAGATLLYLQESKTGVIVLLVGVAVSALTSKMSRGAAANVKKCAYCKSDMPRNASVCPQCGKYQLGVGGAFVIAVLILAAFVFFIMIK